MINYFPDDGEIGGEIYDSIIFTKESKDRIYQALFRGTNTLSPPDMELIKLLEDMKK